MSLPFLLLVALAAGATAKDAARPPASLARVSLEAPEEPVVLHQPFTLTLRVLVDEEGFDRHVVPLFRRAMDVPVQVLAPALEGFEGARVLDAAPAPAVDPETPAPTFALGEAVVHADAWSREADASGRPRLLLEVRRRFVATQPGTFELPAPSLRFAWAESVEEDFLGTRVATSSRVVELEGNAPVVEVMTPPSIGRPEAYVDAVGRFVLRAERLPAEGGLVRVVLEIEGEGEGNLATLTPPSFEALEGFDVLGVQDEQEGAVRRITADLAPGSKEDRVVPPLTLAFYDPTAPPPGYGVVRTEPLGLGPAPSPAVDEDGAPGETLPAVSLERVGLVVAAGLLVLVLAGFGLLWRRRGEGAPAVPRAPAPDVQRRARAEAALAALLARPEAGVAALEAAWVERIAAHLDVLPPAVIDADLAARLARTGVEPALAHRIAGSVVALVAARYGGPAAAGVRAEVARLAAALDALRISPRP